MIVKFSFLICIILLSVLLDMLSFIIISLLLQKIDRVGAASSLFNQEEKKIFALKLYDVRIEKRVSFMVNLEIIL